MLWHHRYREIILVWLKNPLLIFQIPLKKCCVIFWISNLGKEKRTPLKLSPILCCERGFKRGGNEEEKNWCRRHSLGFDLQAHQVIFFCHNTVTLNIVSSRFQPNSAEHFRKIQIQLFWKVKNSDHPGVVAMCSQSGRGTLGNLGWGRMSWRKPGPRWKASDLYWMFGSLYWSVWLIPPGKLDFWFWLLRAQVVAGIESAVDVAAGGMHTAVLDSNGKVCPLDKHQVFPSKTFKKCLLMGTIYWIMRLCAFNADQNGLWASMFSMWLNQVWTFGCNDEGSLGRPIEEEEDSFLPGEVNINCSVCSQCAVVWCFLKNET